MIHLDLARFVCQPRKLISLLSEESWMIKRWAAVTAIAALALTACSGGTGASTAGGSGGDGAPVNKIKIVAGNWPVPYPIDRFKGGGGVAF